MHACGSLVFGGRGGGANHLALCWVACHAPNFYWAKNIEKSKNSLGGQEIKFSKMVAHTDAAARSSFRRRLLLFLFVCLFFSLPDLSCFFFDCCTVLRELLFLNFVVREMGQ